MKYNLDLIKRFFTVRFFLAASLFAVMGLAILVFNNFINAEVVSFLRNVVIEDERQNHRNEELEILNYLEIYSQVVKGLGLSLPIIIETMSEQNIDYRPVLEEIAVATRISNEWIDNIFIGFSDGSLINSLNFVPEEDWDSLTRDWFPAAVYAGYGNVGITDPYLSYATGLTTFSLSTYIPDHFVVGAAISVGTLLDNIKARTSPYSSSFIINSKGYTLEGEAFNFEDFNYEYLLYSHLEGTNWMWLYFLNEDVIAARVLEYTYPIRLFAIVVLISSFLILLVFILSFTTKIESIRVSDNRIIGVIDSMPVALNITNPKDFSVEYANKECFSLFGFDKFEEYRDNFKEVFPRKQPGGENSLELGNKYMKKAFENGKHEFEWLHIDKHGHEVFCYITLIRISMDRDLRIISFIEDLRDREIAFLDDLTQIHNRRFLLKVFSEVSLKAIEEKSKVSLIVFDLDNFKKVNDVHGHIAGDILLKTIASNVKNSINPAYTLVRYGGEEFVILLPNTDEKTARAVATKIKLEIANFPFPTERVVLKATCSFGVYTHDYLTMEDRPLNYIINRADKALYVAKAEGKNRVVSYESIQEK